MVRRHDVWVQRGHCFRTRGATGTVNEQSYVNRVAHAAKRLLDDAGYPGRVTVALADTRIPRGYDLFVALHCDGSYSKRASGASVGYRDDAGRRAARLWKRRYDARGWPYGFRGDNYTNGLRLYYGTRWAADAGVPAAFVLEHGFNTNPTRDWPWLSSDAGRRAAALALADTIMIWAGGQPIGQHPDAQEGDVIDPRNGGQDTRAVQWVAQRAADDRPDIFDRLKKHIDGYKGEWVDGEYGPATERALALLFADANMARSDVYTLALDLTLRRYGVDL